MKPTQQMVDIMRDHNPAARNIEAGLTAALKDVPDVVPFTFPGFPCFIAYIHPPCSTVVDVDPAHAGIKGSLYEQVVAGECDCENTSPWLRIYVEREA